MSAETERAIKALDFFMEGKNEGYFTPEICHPESCEECVFSTVISDYSDNRKYRCDMLGDDVHGANNPACSDDDWFELVSKGYHSILHNPAANLFKKELSKKFLDAVRSAKVKLRQFVRDEKLKHIEILHATNNLGEEFTKILKEEVGKIDAVKISKEVSK